MTTSQRWQDHAACVGYPTDLFFPSTGETPAEAKALCARCPVRDDCLEESLKDYGYVTRGVWGGTSTRERDAIRLGRPAPVRHSVQDRLLDLLRRHPRRFFTRDEMVRLTSSSPNSVTLALRALRPHLEWIMFDQQRARGYRLRESHVEAPHSRERETVGW